MRSAVLRILACLLVVMMFVSTAMAQSIELRLKDGSRWTGEVSDRVELRVLQQGIEVDMTGTITDAGDLWIKINTTVAGERRERLIFKGDILSITTVTDGDGSSPAPSPRTRSTDNNSGGNSPEAADADGGPGVFLLPLSGMVGVELRHQEIEAIGREADKYGPGQIIVLQLETGGGMLLEMDKIAATILEIKKRHRVIAWIREAISAGCATAMLCDEIYFTSMGSAGAMTAFSGDKSLEGEELQRWLDTAARWMQEGGRSPHIAHAMIKADRSLSYDKDPATGKVTFYPNLNGEFILSRPGDNLSFNAQNATHCGFADGVADTTEELAALLDLPKWREVNQYGRQIHAEWMRTVERAQEEVPRIFARLEYYKSGSGDAIEVLGARIRLLEQLLSWMKRAPNVLYGMGIDPEAAAPQIERQIREFRRQIANMRR